MSVFQQLCALPVNAHTKIFCEKIIPEKLISFHRDSLKNITDSPYHIINLADCDFEDFFAQLSITFLGQTALYALKDGDITPTERKKLDLFLKDYSGPHTLYFFTQQPQYEKNALIIDAVITQKTFQELALISNKKALAPSFTEKLFSYRATYAFDESLTLIEYADLLGARHELFFVEWLDRILVDEISLFTLSQYFFSKQKQLFLSEWSRLKDNYPVEFWVSYFSEQLWQASIYIHFAQAGKALEGKRYAYRLPFSFFQKDYKKYTVEQLTQAHQFLYSVDHGLKNGHATDGIELFIHKAL